MISLRWSPFRCARAVLTASALMLAAQAVNAANSASLDGVWKLSGAGSNLQAVGGAIPFNEDGHKAWEANQALAAKGDFSFDMSQMRCSSPGLPRLMLTPKRIRLFQRPQMVAMVFEWNRMLRQIDLRIGTEVLPNPMHGGPAAGGDDVGTMKGSTTGHWEGAVLVAHSEKFSDRKLLDDFIPNSDQLELTERLQLRGANTLEDRVTIHDPVYFTRDWDAVLTYRRLSDHEYPFPEDVCLDRKKAGERSLPR